MMEKKLEIGIDEKVGIRKGLFLGMQHVLSMDLYVFPVILASIIGLSIGESTYMIQMCFFACGLATLVQTYFGLKLPVVQGSSYVCLGALASIATTKGLDVMIGSIIPGAIILCILGFTGVFAKFVKHCIPQFIGGLVILIVGISLSPTAITGIFSSTENMGQTAIPGIVSVVVLLICMIFEYYKNSRLLSMVSVLLAVVSGCIASVFTGTIDFSVVSNAEWFQLPQIFYFGTPKFDFSACIIFVFLYALILIETTGTWITVADVTDTQLDDKQLNRAVIGEGIGCMIASIFGGTPLTGYSSNAGVISITKVGSKQVIGFAAGILVFLGLCPKVMAVIACIPVPVINGVFLIVCQILIASGFKIVQRETMSSRNSIIMGLSIAITVGTMSINPDVINQFPLIIQYFASSGTAVGAFAAVLLNIILPKERSIGSKGVVLGETV